MRFYQCADSGSVCRRTVAITVVTLVSVAGATGCSSPKAAIQPGSTVASSNTNSKGLPKLTASEVDEKIKAAKASTSIPESAKAKAIESIRAQGEP